MRGGGCGCERRVDIWAVSLIPLFCCPIRAFVYYRNSPKPNRSPTLITTRTSLTLAIYTTLLLSFVSYVRFCYLVIHDITNFLGIACFKVQRRDEKGVWRNPVTDEKVRVAQNGTGGVKYVGPEKGKKGRKEKGKKWY
jgi:hypothetical protein